MWTIGQTFVRICEDHTYISTLCNCHTYISTLSVIVILIFQLSVIAILIFQLSVIAILIFQCSIIMWKKIWVTFSSLYELTFHLIALCVPNLKIGRDSVLIARGFAYKANKKTKGSRNDLHLKHINTVKKLQNKQLLCKVKVGKQSVSSPTPNGLNSPKFYLLAFHQYQPGRLSTSHAIDLFHMTSKAPMESVCKYYRQ